MLVDPRLIEEVAGSEMQRVNPGRKAPSQPRFPTAHLHRLDAVEEAHAAMLHPAQYGYPTSAAE